MATGYLAFNYSQGMGPQGTTTSYPFPDPQNQEQVALGQKLYAEQCASCHGANLAGQENWRSPLADGSLPAPPHDQDGHTWHHPDGLLIRIIKFGGASVAPEDFNSGMPAFEDSLTDEEISATLAFIKSRWPKEIRASSTPPGARHPRPVCRGRRATEGFLIPPGVIDLLHASLRAQAL